MSRHIPADNFRLDFSHGLLIRRFFKRTDRYSFSLEGITPGRYWSRWDKPKDNTDFDDAISKLINSGRGAKFRSREDLENEGTLCPYYAWRVHVVIAMMTASVTRRTLSSVNLKNLEDERRAWNAKIAQSRDLLKSPSINENITASIYHQPSDYEFGEVEQHEVTVSVRSNRLEKLREEIKQEEIIVSGLSRHIKRIERLTEKWSDTRTRSDIWRTSFFMYMGNVWTHTTGSTVPTNNSLFTDILAAATLVGSGGASKIKAWGQERALRSFREALEGEGYRRGETGWLCLESQDDVSSRGGEIQELINNWKQQKKINGDNFALLDAAILMREHYEGILPIILQQTIIKHMLNVRKLWSDRLEIQMGWVNEDRSTIERMLTKAIFLAKDGDPAAAGVLKLAYLFNLQAKSFITSKGYWSPAACPDLKDMRATFEERRTPNVPFSQMEGHRRTFEAVLMLLTAYTQA